MLQIKNKGKRVQKGHTNKTYYLSRESIILVSPDTKLQTTAYKKALKVDPIYCTTQSKSFNDHQKEVLKHLHPGIIPQPATTQDES